MSDLGMYCGAGDCLKSGEIPALGGTRYDTKPEETEGITTPYLPTKVPPTLRYLILSLGVRAEGDEGLAQHDSWHEKVEDVLIQVGITGLPR